MIFSYIYFIVFILLYVFLQLNYMFMWFKKLMFDDAEDSIFFGLFFCITWPVSMLIYLLHKLASYMDNIHHKYKYRKKYE